MRIKDIFKGTEWSGRVWRLALSRAIFDGATTSGAPIRVFSPLDVTELTPSETFLANNKTFYFLFEKNLKNFFYFL
jgi:hypothetical protein